MKKRILAFLLCMVMAFSLVGCSKDGDELEKVADQKTRSDNPPITLSLYVPSMSKLTKEARESVEKALNAISIKKYNTTLKFFAYPEEEYVPIVLSKVQTEMASYVTYLDQLDDPDRSEKESAVDYSDYNINLKPADMSSHEELAGAGIDIFVSFEADASSPMFDSESEYYNPDAASKMFDILYSQRVLEALTPRMINDYAVLKSKSYTEFFNEVTRVDMNANAANIDSAKSYAYAMPNNYLLGTYTYLIINKEVVAQAGYTQDYNLLSKLPQNGGAKADARIEALKDTLTKLKSEGKINVDSVFATFDSYDAYKASSESFAIAAVNGDIALPTVIANPNYEIVEYDVSKFDNKECGNAAYCITRAYSATLANQGISEDDRILRCMDILVLIQNDVDFRNTLQYGVKGEHYTIGRDGTVYTSTNEYVMDPAKTGNMFLLYPSDNMSDSMRKLSENNWALAKKQNNQILASKPAQ